jgi:hypothetical protein
MMGIGSLFGLSRGLSVLVEVVRMLNGWERRESQRRVSLDCFAGWVALRRSGGSMPPSDGSGAGVVGCHQLDRSRLAGQVGRFGSLGSPKGEPKGSPKWS